MQEKTESKARKSKEFGSIEEVRNEYLNKGKSFRIDHRTPSQLGAILATEALKSIKIRRF